jgi:hypothetical protein
MLFWYQGTEIVCQVMDVIGSVHTPVAQASRCAKIPASPPVPSLTLRWLVSKGKYYQGGLFCVRAGKAGRSGCARMYTCALVTVGRWKDY